METVTRHDNEVTVGHNCIVVSTLNDWQNVVSQDRVKKDNRIVEVHSLEDGGCRWNVFRNHWGAGVSTIIAKADRTKVLITHPIS